MSTSDAKPCRCGKSCLNDWIGFKMEEFHKVRRLPPYVFEQVNRLKADARAAGADIIDLGMGNPDLPTPETIVDKLCEVVRDPRTHRYSTSRGIPGLRKAQARYYERRFGVKLDPERQVVATLGSKEGFANMAQAITAPGDVVLCPNPTYPIHQFGFIMSGGVVRSITVEPDDSFFYSLERAVRHSIPKPLALILNYPSNPTAQVATLDFYRDVVAFARKHDIIILSDLAYAEIYYNDIPPPSVLEVPGGDGHSGRIYLDVENILDAGLAHGICRWKRTSYSGVVSGQVIPGLRCLHAYTGGRNRRAQQRWFRDRTRSRYIPSAAGRDDRIFFQSRLADSGAGGDNVRVGAASRTVS